MLYGIWLGVGSVFHIVLKAMTGLNFNLVLSLVLQVERRLAVL
jgi:hypothetical protein